MGSGPSQQAKPLPRWYLRRWFVFLVLLLVLVGVGFVGLAMRARRIDEFTRQWVVGELERRFETRVELASVHVSTFPEMTVSAEGLTVFGRDRQRSAEAMTGDVPPLIHVDAFTFHLGWMGLFDVPHRIRAVKVENLQITIPPRRGDKRSAGDAARPPVEKPEGSDGAANRDGLAQHAREIVVDEIVATNADLVILPKDARKPALDWDIHNLVLHRVTAQKPFHFLGSLTNAKPEGEIATEGDFGPWHLDEPGDTPVSGAYNFVNADLNPFPGIAGTLSSTGTYSGQLDSLEVQGETDTPNFSLDKVGKPVPLHTEYSATVDGTNGDTFLHPVKATLGRSLIIAEGSVVKDPRQNGHYISLNVSAAKARIEDLLSLALKSEKPLMSGPVRLRAKLLVPPGKTRMIQKMILEGRFGVDDAKWNNAEVREKLEALSRHAEGKPGDEQAGSALSDLQGSFRLAKGQIHFSRLTFEVPGARIQLAGNYDIPGGDMNFEGHLRMQAKLSQTMTGAKSLFLKAFDPFFSKNGAGTELPIAITGTRENPTFTVSVFHRKIKKQMGTEKSQSAPPSGSNGGDRQKPR
jgi:hypothetical protein